jgi:hypothetical protein
VRTDIGRFYEGRLFETVNLIKNALEVATGVGYDVEVWIHGRELVFGRGEAEQGVGFLRILPGEASITLSFPRGGEVFDPQKRMKGVPGSRTRLVVRNAGDIDSYARRLIEAAYELDSGGF